MKKLLWLGSLLALFLMGTVSWARADEAAAGDDAAPMAHADHGMDGGMGMGGKMMDRMKEKLGLSDSQVSQLKDMFKKTREENQSLRDQAKIDMDTLQQKVDSKASDSDLKNLLDKLQKDKDGLTAARKKVVDQMRDILTPTQQAKMVLSMKQRGRRMAGKWGKNFKNKMKKNSAHKEDGEEAQPTKGI